MTPRPPAAALLVLAVPLLAAAAAGAGPADPPAESPRDRRHRQIRQRLAETADLPHPYFAPSVHIRYRHPDPAAAVRAYYNEIRVERTVRHTYFCTIGFGGGYLGIQDHGTGPLAIFSVWDRGGGDDDRDRVSETDRTQVLFTHPDGNSSRFGGEGSGAKTMLPFAWEVGETYRFLVKLDPLPRGTLYAAWIAEEGQPWRLIARYRTVQTSDRLRGFYSFVEDYARSGATGQSDRLAFYPRQAVMNAAGEWRPIRDARGTIADDLLQNGHSGVSGGVPFSRSGADTPDYETQPKELSLNPPPGPFEVGALPVGFMEPPGA